MLSARAELSATVNYANVMGLQEDTNSKYRPLSLHQALLEKNLDTNASHC